MNPSSFFLSFYGLFYSTVQTVTNHCSFRQILQKVLILQVGKKSHQRPRGERAPAVWVFQVETWCTKRISVCGAKHGQNMRRNAVLSGSFQVP